MLPVRDEERFIERAVLSILRQTFRNLELIVVDDGSTDRTSVILAHLAMADDRVRIIRLDGRGLVESLNTGLAAAAAPYVARMDADDISLPERIARQVAELDRRPSLGVLGTRVRYIDANDCPIGVWEVPVGARLVQWALAFGTPIAHPSVMMRTAVLPPGPYRDSALHAEDYDLWVRLASVTTLDNLADTLLERRVNVGSVSDRNATAQEGMTLRIRQRAIGRVLGREPSMEQVAAMTRPRSIVELVSAVILIGRLYLASRGGADVRRDAWSRVATAAKALLRSR